MGHRDSPPQCEQYLTSARCTILIHRSSRYLLSHLALKGATGFQESGKESWRNDKWNSTNIILSLITMKYIMLWIFCTTGTIWKMTPCSLPDLQNLVMDLVYNEHQIIFGKDFLWRETLVMKSREIMNSLVIFPWSLTIERSVMDIVCLWWQLDEQYCPD